MIDLRSDTVTRPSAGMRQAMAQAEVADDVLDGDPTTASLERRVASLVGHEAALFFPTGTMANQVALGLFARPGSEVVVEAAAHIVTYEQGGASALWGAQLRPIATPDGLLTDTAVHAAIRPESWHYPETCLVTVENTHNAAGGRVLPPERFAALASLTRREAIPIHLDGARLWNAAAACGVRPSAWAGATTVMVSFSKGLGCPAGSCLAGSRMLLERGRRLRRRLGGGMRQSGVLAAACHFALDHHLPRLTEDHDRARSLWEKLDGVRGVRAEAPSTNMVMIDLQHDEAASAAARLAHAGVRVSVFGPRRLRAVTHRDVTDADIERAAAILSQGLVRS